MLPISAPIPLKQLLAHAIHLQRLGRNAEAAQQLRRVLKLQPRHFDALLAMGQCCHADGVHAEAVRHIAAALKIESRSAQAHISHGNALRELGRTGEAIAAYQRAAELEPDLALAHFNLATLLEAADRFDEAAEAYARAAQLDPRDADAMCGRANCLQRLARFDEALAQYDHALSVDPANADAVSNRAALLQQLGRLDEAMAGYQRALALRPDYPDAWLNLGHALLGLDQTDDALACFDRVLALDPQSGTARLGRGRALLAGGRFEQAVDCYRELDAEQPGLDSIENNLAIALMWAERYDEALRRFDDILARNPQRADALMGRANVLAHQGRYQEARPLYDLAMRLEPGFAKNRWNRALCCLILGEFIEGWRDFEFRLSDATIAGPPPEFRAPRWSGDSDPAGRLLLLHAEQGLGDTIQFLRYVPLLVRAGARVVVEVPAPLASLCGRSLPDGVSVIAHGAPLPPFELHCPLMSLPFAFRTTLQTVPADIPYLSADPARTELWHSRLGEASGPRIGLAWSGKARPNRRRSIPLAALRLLERHGCELIGLQNDIRESDLDALRGMPSLKYFGDAIGDFDDTAALAGLCDLVISVDTSVAHLAGAMGRPVWILLPYSPDYRWMLEREDSPWYPTARLFRQRRAGDWQDVVERVDEQLAALPF